MFNRNIQKMLLIVFVSLLGVPGLLAQTAGSVAGHLADPAGANLTGTEVTLTDIDTSTSRTTKSTSAGDYTFTEVPPGTYTIQAKQAGFKTVQSDSFVVQVQQSVRLDLTLQVGAVSESVTVDATGALLQADNASLGTVIDNAEVNELPLNGRNFLGLVALASNVNTLSPFAGQAGSRLGGERASQSISVGGSRIMFDYYTLDGVNNTDPDFNTYIGLPSVDGIQEFKVQTGVYSAEFGHEASQVNVLSKSGSNTYHGSAYDFIRNDTADASSYHFPFNGPINRNPFKWNDFGFELDGAIRIPKIYNGKDKFFFMVDDEWRHIRQSTTGNAVVPSPAIASGNFSGFTTAAGVPVIIYDPATGDVNGLGRTPFPNNTIPSNRISPISAALLKYLGTSTQPFYANGAVTNNYQFPTNAPQDRQSLTVRGDYFQSPRSQWTFRYSSGKENLVSTGLLGAGSKTITNYYQYLGSNTWTVSPHLVNEARFGYTNFFNSTGLLQAFTTDVVTPLGIPGLNGGVASTWGIPDVSFASGPGTTTKSIWGLNNGFGDRGGDGPYVVTDPSWQIVDNVSLIRGKHSFRLGFEYSRQTFNQLGNQFSRGQFSSQPLATALESGTPGNVSRSNTRRASSC
ncbi:MAG: carboxypeptidase-like regulatory domain-containing protein, partial [Acidobacteriota bacterium]